MTPNLRIWIIPILLLFSLSFVTATTNSSGSLGGNAILDTARFFSLNVLDGKSAPGMIASHLPFIGEFASNLQNDIETQFGNKESAGDQTTELKIARQNLENSKDNVSIMFFFIVDTFIIIIDAAYSLVLIAIMMLTFWLLFVGYVKLCVIIINGISGKYVSYARKR